jgi:hypothetical protein
VKKSAYLLALTLWITALAVEGPAALFGGCLDDLTGECSARYDYIRAIWVILTLGLLVVLARSIWPGGPKEKR